MYFDPRLSKSGFISCDSCHNLSMGGTDNLKTSGGPIANPGERAFTHELAVDVLNSMPAYKAEFKQVFDKDAANIDMVTDAIATFEETLVTPGSRFDKWLRGDKKALSKRELAGYKPFKDSGCTARHYGPAVGGTSFQKRGLVAEYDTPNKAQGEADSLETVVEIMGKPQVGRAYSKEEIADIVAFLKTLTGKQPDFKLPILPPSTNDTPKPKPFG